METQVLTTDQMQHLSSLGVDINNASMMWIYSRRNLSKEDYLPELQVYDNIFKQSSDDFVKNNIIPTFTLQDILKILPYTIKVKGREKYTKQLITEYTLEIIVNRNKDYSFKWVYEENGIYDDLVSIDSENPLQAAYEMLLWYIPRETLFNDDTLIQGIPSGQYYSISSIK